MNHSLALAAYLTAWTSNRGFSGTVLVAHKNNIVINQGYGYANDETQELNTPHTVFRIASITKIFTAVAILQLQEQSTLNLDDALSMYIPNYPRGDEITIHHVLSMTSGIPNILKFITPEERQEHITLEALIEKIKHITLEFEPAAKFSYSNSNYSLLAYIIEKTSGLSYAQYLSKYIFKPLQMRNSFVDDGSQKPQQAIGTQSTLGNSTPAKPYDSSWAIGAGNICSTTYDLYLFDSALHAGKIVNAESWKLMQNQTTKTGWDDTYRKLSDSAYGYGLIISPARHNRQAAVGHGGGSGSFSSELIHFLPSDICIIVLINSEEFQPFALQFLTGLEAILFDTLYSTFSKASIGLLAEDDYMKITTPSIFFITGTSGSGKSTLTRNLRALLPMEQFAVYDFDERGVPVDADKTWRQKTTHDWLHQAAINSRNHKTTIICGVTVPSEVLSVSSKPDVPIHFGFIKIDDQTIEQRLKDRAWDDALIEDNRNWSHYLEQEVKKQKGHLILDASHMTPEQVAESFIEWINSITRLTLK